MPNYIVLKDTPTGYQRVGDVTEAPNDIVAIAETVGDDAGLYVAVPTRSFRLREVIIENRPTRKIGDPAPAF